MKTMRELVVTRSCSLAPEHYEHGPTVRRSLNMLGNFHFLLFGKARGYLVEGWGLSSMAEW